MAQRLGLFLFFASIALLCLSYFLPGHASARYAAIVASHIVVYSGFVLGAAADALAGRRFSAGRLAFAIGMGLTLMIVGPIVMSAAAAAAR